MCLSCRYANSSQQAIAARAEQQGLLIEGFNASRLAREQAKLPNAGKGLHNEQVNILNLPMPDFDVTGDIQGLLSLSFRLTIKQALTFQIRPCKEVCVLRLPIPCLVVAMRGIAEVGRQRSHMASPSLHTSLLESD